MKQILEAKRELDDAEPPTDDRYMWIPEIKCKKNRMWKKKNWFLHIAGLRRLDKYTGI